MKGRRDLRLCSKLIQFTDEETETYKHKEIHWSARPNWFVV